MEGCELNCHFHLEQCWEQCTRKGSGDIICEPFVWRKPWVTQHVQSVRVHAIAWNIVDASNPRLPVQLLWAMSGIMQGIGPAEFLVLIWFPLHSIFTHWKPLSRIHKVTSWGIAYLLKRDSEVILKFHNNHRNQLVAVWLTMEGEISDFQRIACVPGANGHTSVHICTRDVLRWNGCCEAAFQICTLARAR